MFIIFMLNEIVVNVPLSAPAVLAFVGVVVSLQST